MDLSRPRSYRFKIVSLRLLLQSILGLLNHDIHSQKVDFKITGTEENDSIWTDPDALTQVLLNLFRNSIESAEQVGIRPFVTIQSQRKNEEIEITIADNGPGIPPEVHKNIFHPFKTTKANGFGLGLTICKDIINALYGTIRVDPKSAAAGAVFHLYLPQSPIDEWRNEKFG